MRTEFDYSPYYYKKEKRRGYAVWQKRVIAACAAMIALSILLYIFLVPKGATYAVELGERSFYAVSIGAFADRESAQREAERIRARGGAGFVAEDGSFKILTSCYTTKADAQSVVANLKKGLVEASVFEISMPAVRLASVSQNAKSTIEQSLGFYNKIYSDLYALTVDIDRGIAQATEIANALQATVLDVAGVLEKLTHLPDSEDSAVLAHIKAVYVSVLNMLESVVLTQNYFDISVDLRYNYLKVLYEFAQLFREISD